MSHTKRKLLSIAQKAKRRKPLKPSEINYLISFTPETEESKLVSTLKQSAFPLSLVCGFLLVTFAAEADEITSLLPSWTNMSDELLAGVDYLWNFLGEPIEKNNIVYHLPNVVLYTFGFFGIKRILTALDKRTWLDTVLNAQTLLLESVQSGKQCLKLKPGHSVLFVGNGDFIGEQFSLTHSQDQSVTISQTKPSYTQVWNYYTLNSLYDDLKEVLECSSAENAGEYVFFPVKDDQIFLPGETAYDLSPHKLDILCQNIRTIETEQRWKQKKIVILGDLYHKSFVQSEDEKGVISNTEETISISSIAEKYNKVQVLDPTEVVLKKILDIAAGRKIVFRATKEGIKEYKERFYNRLKLLGYKPATEKNGVLTIGYDIFEDQTEQQTLSRKIDDYFPVVLSKNVRDALLRNGYKDNEFLYVPELVLEILKQLTGEVT